jgi:PIN domain nuclease of toxin-antitoxin system
VLLDTHTLLWSAVEETRLSEKARSTLLDSSIVKLISPASYWEIAIKISIGKYALSQPYEVFVAEAVDRNGFRILPIEPKHTATLIALPYHHRDPFDRLLIAQAIVEDVDIVSCDDAIDKYPVRRLW